MSLILDVQKLRLLEEPVNAPPDRVLECDVLVAGAGLGGCAAAMAVAAAGRTVVLTEETDWPGGQWTSQGVSAPDEHRFIESFGGTRSYYELRERVRDFYRTERVLSAAGRRAEPLNPGNGWVSRLCCEPAAGLHALGEMLRPHLESGRITLLLRRRAVRAVTEGDRVRSVTFRSLDGFGRVEVRPAFVLDATELGDLLPLTGTEYVLGAEGAAETGEPGARAEAAAWCVQSFTYPFAVEFRPGERHRVARPETYEEDRERQPYTLRHRYYDARGWVTYRMFEDAPGAGGPFWTYRRLIHAALFDDPRCPNDVAMINWPGNDFRHAGIVDVEPAAALGALRRAKALSLGFCYWLQTECPRDDGGAGYPELLLRPDIMGTADGLARYPYIREGRRIRALRTVLEQEISAVRQSGARARLFPDSTGIGLYGIDIHPCEGEEKLPPFSARPFQIPLSALVPVRVSNLLPACKNIGTTHITNGAYRLHPVEWNIGETAGHLSLFCLDRGLSPQAVAADPRRVRRFQRRLVGAGIPLFWFTDVPPDHPVYPAVQLLGAWGVWEGDPNRLEFGPDEPAGPELLAGLAAAPGWARGDLARLLEEILPGWPALSRGQVARLAWDALTV